MDYKKSTNMYSLFKNQNYIHEGMKGGLKDNIFIMFRPNTVFLSTFKIPHSALK